MLPLVLRLSPSHHQVVVAVYLSFSLCVCPHVCDRVRYALSASSHPLPQVGIQLSGSALGSESDPSFSGAF